MSVIDVVWRAMGRISYWLLWPAAVVYSPSTERTRVLLVQAENILVVKSWFGDGKWSLPGGGLHTNEKPIIGALRELAEETGIQLRQTDMHWLGTRMYRNYRLSYTYTLYVATLPSGVPFHRQRFEIVAAKWLNYRDVNPRNSGPDTLDAVGSRWSS